jgi:hypothetical protein
MVRLISFLILFQCYDVLAQLRYPKVFYKESALENENVKWSVQGAKSEFDGVSMRLKIYNAGKKVFIVKPGECSLLVNGKEFPLRGKMFAIVPNKVKAKHFNINGKALNEPLVTLQLKGIYTGDSVKIANVPSFTGKPPKEFIANNFYFKLAGYARDRNEFYYKYEVKYLGESIAMIKPENSTMKSAKGYVYNNKKHREKVYFLRKNQKIVIGFMFVSDYHKENEVFFNDSFSEIIPVKYPDLSLLIEMDKEKTKEEN